MWKYILKKGKVNADNPWCRNVGPETKEVATPETVSGFLGVYFRSVVFQNIIGCGIFYAWRGDAKTTLNVIYEKKQN